MKRILILAFLVASTVGQLHAQQRVSSTVKEVTVYLEGAIVKRQAYARVNPGTSELIFEKLSNFINPSSIEVVGSSGITILAVTYNNQPSAFDEKPAEVQRLKVKLDSARTKLSYVQNEKYALEQEALMLQDNRKLPASEKSIFIEDVQEMAEFYRKRIQEIRNKVFKLQIEESEQSAKVNELQRQYNQATSTSRLASGEISVKVASTNYSNANFTIRYYTTQASWRPFYSMRAESINDQIKLDYDAHVMQSTGEEWKDIRLKLTTNNPVLGAQQPAINPTYVGILQVNPYTYGQEGRAKESAAPAANQDSYAAENLFTSDYTSVVKNQLNTTFEINLSYDVPSNGQEQLVRIQQYQLPATFSYVSMPRYLESAFLNAKVTGWEQYNLLPGPANVFFEGTYVGKAQIDPSVTQDTMNISFGRDENVNIKRSKIKDFTGKQFLGSNKKETYGYAISIRNMKRTDLEITVTDQIPISKNKEVEVELQEKSGAAYDPNTGYLTWKIQLAPQETKTVQFIYSIKYPKNLQLTGSYQ